MPYLDSGVGYTTDDTSLSAAVAAEKSVKTVRASVLRALRASDEPLDFEQIAQSTGLPGCSVRPRLTELKNDGAIQDSGHRGESRYGKKIIQWEIVD